jgi:hypothetical protein
VSGCAHTEEISMNVRFSIISGTVVALAGAAALAAAVLNATGKAPQAADVAIQIDATANRHAINPLVYGVNGATASELAELNAPLARLGGNHTSRYNWEVNAYNRALDWYFESVGESSAVAGESADTFIGTARAAGAEPMITVPMVGWVAKLGANRARLASFSIAKYGPQAGNDWQWFPDAGNGVRTAGGYVTGNDPNDANVASGAAFQQGFVQHLVSRWGGAANGGQRYYTLDNEPSLWFATHRDVEPVGVTMDEYKTRFIDYATMVKDADVSARIVGPEEWGWPGYFYSGYDQQYAQRHGWSATSPDRAAHGGADYLPWLLDQLRQHEAATGRHLLDVFSVHYYPQGGEHSTSTTSTTQLLRNRSTRSLWDPAYVDESWIGTQVQLIPRLRSWVNTYYAAGTPIAIAEYSWGAEAHISGAMAQADVLGIFGREGLDMAARWETPAPSTPTFKAMKMYRNYDGNRSAFGETSVKATAPNPDEVAAFAAVRTSDGALTVMVLNKLLSSAASVTLSLAGFTPGGPAERWQLTSSNVITRLADVAPGGASLAVSLPQQSITLFVIPGGSAPPPAAVDAPTNLTASVSGRTVSLRWKDNASNETGFYVERRVSGKKTTFARVGTVGVNVSAFSETLARGTCEYRVQAFDATSGMTSGYSNVVQVRVR